MKFDCFVVGMVHSEVKLLECLVAVLSQVYVDPILMFVVVVHSMCS